MPGEHAKFSPSSSGRWLYCTASFYRHEQPKDSGPAAKEGLLAHDLAAKVLIDPTYEDTLHGFEDTIHKGIKIDNSFIEYCMDYVNFVLNLAKGIPRKEIQVEQRVSINSECWGTADVRFKNSLESHIIDLKFGRGVPVKAENNTQEMIYGFADLEEQDPFDLPMEEVHMHIYQPRLPSGCYSGTHTMLAKELNEWGHDFLLPTIEDINSNKVKYFPSEEVCMWCKPKGGCKHRARKAMNSVALSFKKFIDPIKRSLPEPEKYSNIELSKILIGSKGVRSWLNSCEEEALDRKLNGEDIPEHKIIESLKFRQFKPNKEKMFNFLSKYIDPEKLYKKTFVSPAQAEKLLKKKKDPKLNEQLQKCIYKPEGNPKLVHINSPGTEIQIESKSKFKNYTKEE